MIEPHKEPEGNHLLPYGDVGNISMSLTALTTQQLMKGCAIPAGSKRKAYTGTYRDLPLDEGVLQQAHQEAAAHAAKTAISVGA